MKIKILIIVLLVCFNLHATDDWRVKGLSGSSVVVKNSSSSPPFLKWQNYDVLPLYSNFRIEYTINSGAPSATSIENALETWEDCGYIDFVDDSPYYLFTSVILEHSWFANTNLTINTTTGEIESMNTQFNKGTHNSKPVYWINGPDNHTIFYYSCDIESQSAHEIGHALGIAHHSTGTNNPTMGTRDDCTIFNSSTVRRTLGDDDWYALDFLYKNAHVPSEFSTISNAFTQIYYADGGTVTVSSGSNDYSGTLTSEETLFIKSAATVNVTGSGIIISGGTITIENVNSLNPNIALVDNGDNTDGYYPSLSSAITAASSGETIKVNSEITLTQNTTIPAGVTLEIESGYVVLENCTLSLGTGAEIEPNVRVMNGTTIEGYYPSISEALTATTTGEVVEISDDYTSTVDVTVGNGKTLKPQSGSELKFASGKYLYVNSGGNLTASGATFTNSSGIWNGIKYQSGSSGSLTNCTISDARYGVYLNGSSRTINNCSITTAGTSTNYGIYINSASPTITDCDITGTEFSNTTIVSYGIYCYGDDDEPTISDNIIEATYGIYIYDSSPDIDGNEVVSESVGLYCENNASPFLVEAASHGNNQFSGDFSEFGVFATNSSNPTLGWQNCSSDYYGRNSFDYSYIDDRLVYAGTGCTIMAEHCWWGTSSPSSSLFYGSVDYTPYLSSAPSSLAPNPEGNLFDQRFMLASAVPDGSEEASEDLTRYYNDQWDLDKKIGFLRYLFSIGEAKGVADLCKDIIYENPYASESFLVLDMMYQISKNNKIKKDFDKEQLKAYIESFDDKMGSQLLKSKADLILAGLEKNMPLIDKVYKKNIDTYLGKYALQQKFMYYYHEEENLEEARTALDLMDEVYPDEIVTYEAHVLMGDEVIAPNEFYSQYFNTDATEQAQLASTDIADILPVEFELYKAYPNPFNPSTTLEYALPVQSKVECSIYSISGELVKSFNFDQVAGTHSVTWDGAAESSGIYLVRFTAEAQNGSNSFVDYQKVTLLK